MQLEPFRLERFFAHHEFSSRYLLSSSDCQGLAMADLVAAADPDSRALWDALHLGYTESDGLPELRAEIARLYEHVDGDEVLVAAPEELIFLTMNALLRPGDHVVCTFPGYQSLYEVANAIGCEVNEWRPVEMETSWHFDPAELKRLMRLDTRLVVWNFPHNPTGALPSPEDFAQMLHIVRAAGAWLFSDEMYRLLEPAGELPLPAAVDRYGRGLSLSGMSKSFSLAGLRIGWVATHDMHLLDSVRCLKDYTTICSSAPSEILALMGLRQRDKILAANRDRIVRNVEAAEEFFKRHRARFSWGPPRANREAKGQVCWAWAIRS